MSRHNQQFVLRWHYHEPTLLHGLSYFLDQDLLTDVTISVGAQQVRAHKVILAMCSVYFLQLFQEMKSSHPVVVLHNVSFDEVKAILSFMYRGQCVVSQEELPNLLSVAKLLKVQGLCDMKVPDKQVQTSLTHNENARREDDMPTNDDPCDKYENALYNNNSYNRQDQNESINLKRRSSDEVPVQDLSKESKSTYRNHSTDDKTGTASEDLPETPPKPDTAIEPFSYPSPCSPNSASILRRHTPAAALPSVRDPSAPPSETCKCFLCGKYLSNQYNLRVHMETHQEAYHACHACPHVSRSRDALRKHVSYRHPEEYHNRKRKKTNDS